eukprot:3350742-Lingulodinium_polyedra.AAC.1
MPKAACAVFMSDAKPFVAQVPGTQVNRVAGVAQATVLKAGSCYPMQAIRAHVRSCVFSCRM